MAIGLQELIFLKAGQSIAKFLFKKYLKDYGGDVAADLTSIGTDKIQDFFERRRLSTMFEDMAARIISQLPELDENINTDAISAEFSECLKKVSVTETLIATAHSPVDFFRLLRDTHKVASPPFSDAEVGAYQRLLESFSLITTQIALQLPEYNSAFAKHALNQLSAIMDGIDTLGHRISEISRRVKSANIEYNSYELSYRLTVAAALDSAELIGITIPFYLQIQKLANTYVKLMLTPAAGGQPRPARDILNVINRRTRRLLIRGGAGMGKSTLAKWIAIQASMHADATTERLTEILVTMQPQHVLLQNFLIKSSSASTANEFEAAAKQLQNEQIFRYYLSRLHHPADDEESSFDEHDNNEDFDSSATGDSISESNEDYRSLSVDRLPEVGPYGLTWHQRVPFLLKLREFPSGELPPIEAWPELTTKFAGAPPRGWAADVLKKGRGLVIIDGIDEIPQFSRPEVRRVLRTLTSVYSNNLFVVTTRPAAVPSGWLEEEGFVEVMIDPLTTDDRNQLIQKWHSTLAGTGFHDPERLRISGQRLANEIETVPAISQIAVNPLLCAMICALNIDRRGQLPKNQRDLCNALLDALLHRRDAEQSIPLSHFAAPLASFTLDQKKIILRKIAYYLVTNNLSALHVDDADSIIGDIIKNYSGFENVPASEVRDYLIERTGIIREPVPHRVDFVHNTFKEFLAAERFVEERIYRPLAANSTDASWAPVLFFATASSHEKYVDRVLQELITMCGAVGGSAEGRQLQVLLATIKAYAVAIYVTPDKRAQIRSMLKHVLPPRHLDDVTFIATLGDEVVDDLPAVPPIKEEHAQALARLLAQIGTPCALSKAAIFSKERRKSVIYELLDLIEPVNIPYIKSALLSGTPLDFYLANRISRMSSSDGLEVARALNFEGFSLQDYRFLCGLNNNLERLKLRGCPVTDLSYLSSLKKLRYLDLEGSFVTDVSFLSEITQLEDLNVNRTPVRNLNSLAFLERLRFLAIWDTDVHSLPKEIIDRVVKIYTNSIALREELPEEKLMSAAQASRLF